MDLTLNNVFALLAALLVTWCYIPYAKDIMRGKAKPARSARLMLILLIIIALLQQISMDVGWILAVTVGETIGSLAILVMALKRGVGGFSRTDVICYILLIADLCWWLATRDALLALHLTIIADTIAFYPTLIKTWHNPTSETPLFYIVGTIAPLMNILAVGNYSYQIIVFPLYLAAINGLEVFLIYIRPKTACNDVILAE